MPLECASLLALLDANDLRGAALRAGASSRTPELRAKSHGQFRFQWLLKTEKVRTLAAHLQQTLAAMTLPEDVILTWDVDAMSLM